MTHEGTNIAKGDKVTNTGGFAGEAPFNPVLSPIGSFNARIAFSEGKRRFKFAKYASCDIGS